MKRILIGGAVLSASLLLGAGPALACGHPGHGHKPSGHHKPVHHTHKSAKPRHHHSETAKPCQCHKPKPPCPKPPHRPPTHHHHKPPTHVPGPGHHGPTPKPHKLPHHVPTHQHKVSHHAHRATPTAQLVSVSTPASLPRTGGTPWVLIYAGGAFLLAGSAIRLAAPLRKHGRAS